MPELRWILLALGGLLIGGVWLWGRRNPASGGDGLAAARAGQRHEPLFEAERGRTGAGHEGPDGEEPAIAHEDLPTVELPARYYEERRAHGANPPVVTIDDLPENAEDVVLVDADEARAPLAPPAPAQAPPPPVRPPEPRRAEGRRLEPRMPERDAPAPTTPDEPLNDEPPTVTVDVPTLPTADAVVDRRRPRPPPSKLVEAPLPPPPAKSDPLADTIVERQQARPPPAEPPSREQRILAIRLLAPREQPIAGARLKEAIAAERLTYGRYAIFHRLLEGDRPVYSIASLVEPGSFDPDLMVAEQFPGISLFAVFPGPLPAPQAFDELLATARRLADKLGGVLQDDTGSSLTGQRVLSLREDLVHFEHLVSLGRGGGRPGG